MGSGQSKQSFGVVDEQKKEDSIQKIEDCNILYTDNYLEDKVKQVNNLIPKSREHRILMDRMLEKNSDNDDSDEFIVFEHQPTYSPDQTQTLSKQQIHQLNMFQSSQTKKSVSPRKTKQSPQKKEIPKNPIQNLKYNYQLVLYH